MTTKVLIGRNCMRFYPRIRSRLRWTILGVSAVSLLFAVWAWWLIDRPLRIRLRSLSAAGLPTSASELNTYYDIPAGEPDRTREWVHAIDSLHNAKSSLPSALREIAIAPGPFPPPAEPWPDYESYREVVNALEDEFQLLRAAAKSPGFVRYPIDCTSGVMTLISQARKARGACTLLVLDINVCARQGQHSRILDDIKLIDSLSDTLQRGPMIFSFYDRSAIYTVGTREVEKWLAYCDWSDDELESIQTALLSANFKEEAIRCLNGDRAHGLTANRTIFLGPFRPSHELEYVNVIQDSIDSFSTPWPEPLNRQTKISSHLSSLDQQLLSSLRYYQLSSLGGAFQQFCRTVATQVAYQRCICLLIAAQRFRHKHGRLPDSLEEIENALLGPGGTMPELRLDPFNGLPLCFRSDTEGISIYSVSENLIDDGGETVSPATPLRDRGFKLLQSKMVYSPDHQ